MNIQETINKIVEKFKKYKKLDINTEILLKSMIFLLLTVNMVKPHQTQEKKRTKIYLINHLNDLYKRFENSHSKEERENLQKEINKTKEDIDEYVDLDEYEEKFKKDFDIKVNQKTIPKKTPTFSEEETKKFYEDYLKELHKKTSGKSKIDIPIITNMLMNYAFYSPTKNRASQLHSSVIKSIVQKQAEEVEIPKEKKQRGYIFNITKKSSDDLRRAGFSDYSVTNIERIKDTKNRSFISLTNKYIQNSI